MRRLLTSGETGKALGVSQVTVWTWHHEGRGPVQPVAIAGRRLLFDPADVERAQAERAKGDDVT